MSVLSLPTPFALSLSKGQAERRRSHFDFAQLKASTSLSPNGYVWEARA